VTSGSAENPWSTTSSLTGYFAVTIQDAKEGMSKGGQALLMQASQ
jgi:hypothetical protein